MYKKTFYLLSFIILLIFQGCTDINQGKNTNILHEDNPNNFRESKNIHSQNHNEFGSHSSYSNNYGQNQGLSNTGASLNAAIGEDSGY